ncbi:hypothetical protein MTO96_004748 [Rhipicephalus appendiculatus]
MRHKTKVTLYGIAYCTFVFVFLKFEVSYMRRAFSRMDLHYGGLLLDLPGCKFPEYSTFHWTMRLVSLLEQSAMQTCSKAAVVYLSGNALMLDGRLLRERYGLVADQLVCASHLKGFANPPADYYTRPIVLAIDMEAKITPALCAGSRLKTGVYLEYVRNVLSMANKTFAYVWIGDIPHQNHTELAILDDPLEGFLRDLTSLGVLERTALFFLSDHGVRYGSIRVTEAGRHEDLTPFAFVALPPLGSCGNTRKQLCTSRRTSAASSPRTTSTTRCCYWQICLRCAPSPHSRA